MSKNVQDINCDETKFLLSAASHLQVPVRTIEEKVYAASLYLAFRQEKRQEKVMSPS